MVRIDEKTNPLVEQSYLTFEGTPAGFRWLADQLTQMATSAENNGSNSSAIVAPWDFKNKPIKLTGWDSIDLQCRQPN